MGPEPAKQDKPTKRARENGKNGLPEGKIGRNRRKIGDERALPGEIQARHGGPDHCSQKGDMMTPRREVLVAFGVFDSLHFVHKVYSVLHN